MKRSTPKRPRTRGAGRALLPHRPYQRPNLINRPNNVVKVGLVNSILPCVNGPIPRMSM